MNNTSDILLWCVTLFTGASLVITPLAAEAQTTIQRDPASTSEQSGDPLRNDQIRTTEAERIRANDERARAAEAERMRANDDRRSDRHRGEMYVAGFGGVTFGHNFDDVERTGAGAGLTQDDIGLSNSIVYGAKVGYFLPDRMSWLGFEVEGFNTTPHLEQQGQIPGSHLRVTTVAFNVVARAQMACDDQRSDMRDRDVDRDVGDRSRRTSADRHHRKFCRLQPYIGAGPGIFFANASNGTSSSDNGVVGFNGMAGMRYFFTEQVALFGEYKYNSATFEFDNVSGTGPLKGDYSASQVVGGLSFHF